MIAFKVKLRLILLILSLLILLGCIGLTAYLLFSNYQQTRLFTRAESEFRRGNAESLALAKVKLQQVIQRDGDNEAAYIMLAEIAGKQKNYPEQVYYCFMAHRLNPLSRENKAKYISSLCYARYFKRLETFLSQQQELPVEWQQLLLYSAGLNGHINKYNMECRTDVPLGKLTVLLFKDNTRTVDEKLSALDKLPPEDFFLQQETAAAKLKFFLGKRDIDNAEKTLLKAYKLNKFVFAPILGRFYANFRSFDKALKIFEKYLADYHDPAVAMQTAEIFCLLRQTEKIAKLRNKYQSDPGELAMLCCYYFDALVALANNDMVSLKELTVPLRKNFDTPLAAFMFFITDILEGDLGRIRTSYTRLLAHRSYLDLQKRADIMLSDFLKKSLKGFTQEEQLLSVATVLYGRLPEAFTARLILLIQKKNGNINVSVLQDALKRFSQDSGIMKIGVEYYLLHDISEAERLMANYKKIFPGKSKDIRNYEIAAALRKKEYDRASELFQKYFSSEILLKYWAFASLTLRENDLLFLSRDKLYKPFCNALLALKRNDKKTACDLLENADAKGNTELLFFAARILGENGRIQAALNKYAQFPAASPYQLAVLLNQAELLAEKGDLTKALDLSRQAYKMFPDLPETQLCYADKLYKSGNVNLIPEVIKLSSGQTHRHRLEKLWVAGMQARINQCDIITQKETIRELCRRLLAVVPDNSIALGLLKKIEKQ